MSTANNVELLIITVVLAALFIAALILIIEVIVLVYKVKKVVIKAEKLILDVGTAAESLKDLGKSVKGRFPLLNIIKSVVNSVKKD